ncbi:MULTISPECIES: 6,7-dimethyl-8-ribityllumazine synthase [Salegentibacter]|uniref:6,7-dimethyl-8-ribityllumazine synthase n=1 Tax=Salegentibacter maritimus TaxID=2794347 RepID=A0ABS0TFJ5_9FLAO|nr:MULTISPECIES: 6,7-dimethyl-8-ribityllumazine synthase [Salegentibacter]MBE7639160.1 6,7-dimethyl-8-ribityllumazine synthase [Salegentibacter sp. BLCTC]MBI6117280.1 6,7-dimethyl-8-ribityllumazine synthase [Salegentibacter maritimus]MBI6119827.1 6,7-dimethyl-8-ribityllumazine synthase [Salegentibacter maritimus]
MATAGNNLSEYDKDKLPDASDFRIGIVVSEWNEQITEGLYNGAYNALIENNVTPKKIVRWNVPGSFELIYGCKKMQETFDMLDAIIAIGSVIEGETKHFDFVCEGVTQGIKDLNIQTDTPIIFCVLTDQNMQQAIDRSGGKHGNKGTEAAIAAIKMAKLRQDAKY